MVYFIVKNGAKILRNNGWKFYVTSGKLLLKIEEIARKLYNEFVSG
ncbi:hypothetical protein [uncultured Ilyobacter sp.]|nr:hypothetical protein [uncultured Ilyobacter sp.]